MSDLVKDWNATLPERIEMARTWNTSVEERYRSGALSTEAAQASLEPIPEPVAVPTHAWVRWWRQCFGWSLLTRGGDDQQWLPYDHVDMVQSRAETKELLATGLCHPYLLLNYDQLWRTAWGMSRFKLHYKHRSGTGRRVGKTKVGQRQDKKVHAVKGSRRSITVPWSVKSLAAASRFLLDQSVTRKFASKLLLVTQDFPTYFNISLNIDHCNWDFESKIMYQPIPFQHPEKEL